MEGLSSFRNLPARQRALLAVAVLLDGREAPNYLGSEGDDGKRLYQAAEELAAISPELRMPLLGSLLRVALSELELERL
ncbi:MAG: hypothetical protein J5J00_10270 [Deltaproteobacteria bacterium]|nr:hypothetical protein [Deltaproteobacteria bacterium]